MPKYSVRLSAPLEIEVDADNVIDAQKKALAKVREDYTALKTWEAHSAMSLDEQE